MGVQFPLGPPHFTNCQRIWYSGVERFDVNMPVLTDLDKHLLQSAINSQVCALKKLRKGLYQRFMDKDLPEKNYQSGLVALAKHIHQLHDLERKLGCWEGFSQQPKKGTHAAPNTTGNQGATQGDS